MPVIPSQFSTHLSQGSILLAMLSIHMLILTSFNCSALAIHFQPQSFHLSLFAHCWSCCEIPVTLHRAAWILFPTLILHTPAQKPPMVLSTRFVVIYLVHLLLQPYCGENLPCFSFFPFLEHFHSRKVSIAVNSAQFLASFLFLVRVHDQIHVPETLTSIPSTPSKAPSHFYPT